MGRVRGSEGEKKRDTHIEGERGREGDRKATTTTTTTTTPQPETETEPEPEPEPPTPPSTTTPTPTNKRHDKKIINKTHPEAYYP